MKKLLFLLLTQLTVNLSAQTVLTNKGSLVHVGGNPSNSLSSLYINGKIVVEEDGKFTQKGKTTLTGDFINNVTSGTVFSLKSTGLVEFKNNSNIRQIIGGTANKGTSYINFPDVTVNNSGAVLLEATMGMSVNNLRLTKGRLILDSKVKDARLVDNAHLLVSSNVNYDRTPASAEDKGVIQVNLDLGDNYTGGKVVGFTPPFKKVYTDYFFYNVLTRPTASGLTGDDKRLITNPRYALESGKGYILGQGIIDDPDYWETHWDVQWSETDHSKRATESYSFARDFAEPSFAQYAIASDRFMAEEVNYLDVPVVLEKGWNYLGNPFTTPLDISSLVDEVPIADEWGVTRALTNVGEVNARVYVMSGGEGTYNASSSTDPFRFSVSYLLGQKIGSTLELDNYSVDKLLIAPMQMFTIGVYDGGAGKTMKIPSSKRTHADVQFYRTRNAKAQQALVDEFLLEVKDQTTEGFDRLTIVFRSHASLAATDKYDASKLFNNSKGVSQIYTQSSDGKLLTANVVPPDTKSLVMYLSPTTITQEVSFEAYRLSTLQSVSQVILEDRVARKTVELTKNPAYTFTSSPTDRLDRFVLHFSQDGTGIGENSQDIINAYYNQGMLKLSGLSEVDYDSDLFVSDVQGRLIFKTTVQEVPEAIVSVLLNQGTYIVKMAGKRNYVNKILAK